MKKLFSLVIIILIILSSLTIVSAMECQQFSIKLPDGFAETEGWGSNEEHINEIYAATGIPRNGEVHRWLQIEEIGTTAEYNDAEYSELFESEYSLENYTEENLFIGKISIPNFDNGIIHENCTYAYFDKAGYHYEMIITYKGNINNLKLSDDVKLVKEVKDSLKHKS